MLAIAADDEGLAEGEEPKQRAFNNVLRVLKSLKVDGVTLFGANCPEIVNRVHAANNRIFRPIDIQEGGVHLGFFMFRDLFARLSVPLIFGQPKVDFVSLVDLSNDQKRWMSSDEEAISRFEDQALDLFDFAYGNMEFGHTRPVSDRSKELIYRAHVQLEAAAATATSAYDFRGTLQSALLGVELALKGGLACHEVSDQRLRKIGHNLEEAAHELGEYEPDFDTNRVVVCVKTFPNFAQSRYGGPLLDRRELGNILMKAQFIASEVTRRFTNRNIRLRVESCSKRTYPPIN